MQSCCSVERVYVDKAIYEEFLEEFVKATKKMKVGLLEWNVFVHP